MSVTPQQMQQMLAMYKQQFPQGQPAPAIPPQTIGLTQPGAVSSMTPQGTNKTAGGINGAGQLITALMKAQKQKQIQQQLNQAQVQAGMPQANATQQSAIQDMLQQNPVQPIFPSSGGATPDGS